MASERNRYKRVSVKVRSPEGERLFIFEADEAQVGGEIKPWLDECHAYIAEAATLLQRAVWGEQREPFDDGPAAKVLAAIGVKAGDRVNFEWPDGATSRATVTAARNDYIIFDDERAVNRKHILALWPAKAKEEEEKCQSKKS